MDQRHILFSGSLNMLNILQCDDKLLALSFEIEDPKAIWPVNLRQQHIVITLTSEFNLIISEYTSAFFRKSNMLQK